MNATVIPFPLVPTSTSKVVLSIRTGPALLVEVIEERFATGNVQHHVTRRSIFGGPVALVRANILGLQHAVTVAHAEAGR
jgi:hypothetical protein